METATCNLKDHTNYGLRNPMHTSALSVKQFKPEPEGRFRDLLQDCDAVYSKQDIRSEFIEHISLD